MQKTWGKETMSKTWAMNCVLAGARAIKFLQLGREDEAKELLKNLTSEFQPEDIGYLIFRLRDL